MPVTLSGLTGRVQRLLARPGDPPTGHSLYSPANDRRFEHWVWSPPGATDLPVVLLLHGVNDASGFLWWQRGRAQETATRLVRAGEVPPFLLVLGTDGGFGYGSAYLDWADGSARVETHIMGELLPWIDATFPTNGRRHLCGNSMGGYGAFTLALRHPDRFASVSALSAYFRPRTRLSRDSADREAAMYGDAAGRAAHDPHELVAGLPAGRRLPMAFDCGTDDVLLDESRQFHARLDALGVEHQYREFAGGHDWAYWGTRLAAHLRFHLAGGRL